MNPKGTEVYYLYGSTHGTGYYRMIWPYQFLQERGLSGICTNKWFVDPKYLEHIKTIRIQGLVSPATVNIFKHLMEYKRKMGFKVIYELDDIPFKEVIPDYNMGKSGYDTDEIRTLIGTYMNSCDEITCTNTYFRDALRTKIVNPNISVIPNFHPRNWIKAYFNSSSPRTVYNETRNRPRILYAGSANHFSMDGKHKDDFDGMIEYISKTTKDFEWIFLGGMPKELVPLVNEGKIKYHKFVPVNEMGYTISAIRPSLYIAPLQNNVFNNCKSNIKLIESGMLGIPFVGQDIEPYKETPYRFKDMEGLDKNIRFIMKSPENYIEASNFGLAVSKNYLMETDENIKLFQELHETPYGDQSRIHMLPWQNYLTKPDLAVK